MRLDLDNIETRDLPSAETHGRDLLGDEMHDTPREAGMEAGWLGKPQSSCPIVEKVCRHYWILGWKMGVGFRRRFLAVTRRKMHEERSWKPPVPRHRRPR